MTFWPETISSIYPLIVPRFFCCSRKKRRLKRAMMRVTRNIRGMVSIEISVSRGLSMIMATSVPTTLITPENSCVTDWERVLDTLSTSLVRRDMMSPLEWVSKYFSGNSHRQSNRSLRSLKEVFCAT